MYQRVYKHVMTKGLQLTSKKYPLNFWTLAPIPQCAIRNNRYISGDSISMSLQNDGRLFKGVGDRYKGVTIDSENEPCNVEQFAQKLNESLNTWAELGKRTIWFKVSLKDSEWVPILTKNGFNFHHAREGFVMMYKWIPRLNDSCNIPPYAHTNLGVGAIVINEKNEILAVSEKYLEVPHWKLPGGYVEMGEDIADAAVREVKEETGIDTKFESVIAFRHAHKMMFGNSDIYMIVSLIPQSSDIKLCPKELVGCEWMEVDKYLNHPNVHVLNRMLIKKWLEHKRRGIKFEAVKSIFKMITMEKEFTIFSVKDEEEK